MASVFLSHNHKDKEFVRKLNADLQKRGIKTWFDEAEILVGDSLMVKIQTAIDEMDYLAVVISSSSVKSQWVTEEVKMAFNEEIYSRKVKVLPLWLDDCEMPGFLRDKAYADFRSPEGYADALQLLIRSIQRDSQEKQGQFPTKQNIEDSSHEKFELEPDFRQQVYEGSLREAGREAVEKYYRSLRKSGEWQNYISTETILPYEKAVVWSILLETQYLGCWLNNHDYGEQPLPERFGLGEEIATEKYFSHSSYPLGTYIVDYKERDYSANELVIQRQYYDNRDPFYYHITVAPSERYHSKFKIAVYGPKKVSSPLAFIARIARNRSTKADNTDNIVDKELGHHIKSATKSFGQLCYDRINFGPYTGYLQSSISHPANWYTWFHGKGKVYYYQNKDGHMSPYLGEKIKENERVGYVVRDDESLPESYYKDRNYISTYGGYVRELLIENNQPVENYDRLFMLTDEQNTELSKIKIQVPSRFGNYPMITDIFVSENDVVNYGDPLFKLKEDIGQKHFTFNSRYRGQVAKIFAEEGQELEGYDDILKLKIPRLKI